MKYAGLASQLAAIVAVAAVTVFHGVLLTRYLLREQEALDIRVSELRQELSETNARIASAQTSLARNRTELGSEQTRFLTTLFRRKSFSWTGLFNELEKLTPPSVRITSIAPAEEEGEITVTMTVVVVLPCVPATATRLAPPPPETSSPRASARRTTGMFRALARCSSGWFGGTAAVTITARAPSTWLGLWPCEIATSKAVRSAIPAPEVSVSQPVMATPRCLAIKARALIPAPAMPMK